MREEGRDGGREGGRRGEERRNQITTDEAKRKEKIVFKNDFQPFYEALLMQLMLVHYQLQGYQ
jgi:hypothetical protein